MHRRFSKEDTQMAPEPHRKMLSTTSHEGNAPQNHDGTPLHLHQDGWNWTMAGVGEAVGQSEPSHTAGGNATRCGRFGKRSAGPQKVKVTTRPGESTARRPPTRREHVCPHGTCTRVSTDTLFTAAKKWKRRKRPSADGYVNVGYTEECRSALRGNDVQAPAE